MSYPASASILSLFSPFPAAPMRGLRGLPGLTENLQLVQDGTRILLGSIAAPYLTENPENPKNPQQARQALVPLRARRRARREAERQDEAAGLTIAITTRSPLLLHDLDL